MTREGQAIRDGLAPYLDDPASRWSLGGFGAGAEFGCCTDEPVAALGRFGRVTPRGALILELPDDLVPVAYETGFRGGWSHAVALCLPASTGLVRGAGIVTPCGPDTRSARAQDRDAPLFDLGLAIPQGRAGLRTRDPRLAAALSAACGQSAFAPGSPIPRLLAERTVDVVITTRLGRIEVFADGPSPGPDGPRAFVAPEVLRSGRTHAATAPIPAGLVPFAHLHPPHPCRDIDGRTVPFDAARHAAFQALMARWGDPARVILKARLFAGEGLPTGADRWDRAVARVVAAQAAHGRTEAEPPMPTAGGGASASSRDVGKTIYDTVP